MASASLRRRPIGCLLLVRVCRGRVPGDGRRRRDDAWHRCGRRDEAGAQGECCNESRGLAAAGRRVPEVGVEDGEEAAFEFLAACHGECHGGCRGGADGAHDVEQVFRVVGRAGAAGEGEVIACAFAFGAEAFGGHPDERVEPVYRADERPSMWPREVAAAHVRELVEQYGLAAVERPRFRFGGQHDHRRDHATGEWHFDVVTDEQAGWRAESEAVGDLEEGRAPGGVIEW